MIVIYHYNCSKNCHNFPYDCNITTALKTVPISYMTARFLESTTRAFLRSRAPFTGVCLSSATFSWIGTAIFFLLLKEQEYVGKERLAYEKIVRL